MWLLSLSTVVKVYADGSAYQFSFLSMTNTSFSVWAPWVFIHSFIDEQLCCFHSLGNSAWCSYEHLYRIFCVKECLHVFECIYRNWHVAPFEEISDRFHCSYTISLCKTKTQSAFSMKFYLPWNSQSVGTAAHSRAQGSQSETQKLLLVGKQLQLQLWGQRDVKFTLISYVHHSILAKMISETLIKFSVHLCPVYTEKS